MYTIYSNLIIYKHIIYFIKCLKLFDDLYNCGRYKYPITNHEMYNQGRNKSNLLL